MRKLTAEERRFIADLLEDALTDPLHFEMNQNRELTSGPDPDDPMKIRHEASPEVTLTLKVIFVPKGKTK